MKNKCKHDLNTIVIFLKNKIPIHYCPTRKTTLQNISRTFPGVITFTLFSISSGSHLRLQISVVHYAYQP